MTNMKKFLKALFLFIRMYRDGFYFSHLTSSYRGTSSGFYRFNGKNEFAMFDIDFAKDSSGAGYFHLHGGDFRLHWDSRGTIIKREVKQPIKFKITS